jgi:DNA gyrase subunit B
MLDKNAGRVALLPKIIFVEGRDEVTNVAVEVALTYNDSYSEHIYSYVNNINTIEGGTHVAGFRRALTRVFKAYGDKQGLFERAKVEIEGDDFREGLSTIISVKVPEPQFEGRQRPNWGIMRSAGWWIPLFRRRWMLIWKRIPGKPRTSSRR